MNRDVGPTLSVAPAAFSAAPESDAPVADTAPAPIPEIGNIAGDLMTPNAGATAPLDLSNVEPVFPNPQSVAPQIPASEDDLTLSVDPAQPAWPDQSADAGTQAAAGTPDEQFIVLNPAAITQPDTAEVATAETLPAAPGDKPVNPETGAATVTFAQEPATGVADVADPAQAAETTTTPAGPPPRVGLSGELARAMPSGTNAVQVRRLGTAPAATTAAGPQSTLTPDAPAIRRFAAVFDRNESRPLMGLILIDDGAMPGGPEALVGLPMPVTIALDPGREGAADAMASYRAAGIEVVAMAQIPAGALPSDVEVAYEAAFMLLPETVALLDIGSGGLQGDRAVTTQAMDILAASGRGLITDIRGLNEAARAATKADVPNANVYRDLDSEGQDARVIRRFLDQAAFQARRDTGVILLGRLRPDTISALILWGTANRDGDVAFAPLSAVLLAGTAQ